MHYLKIDLRSNTSMVCFLSEDEEQIFKRYKLSEIEALGNVSARKSRLPLTHRFP